MNKQTTSPPPALQHWVSDPATGDYAVPGAPKPKRRRARAIAAAAAAAAVAGFSGYAVGHVTADGGATASQVGKDSGAPAG